MWGGAWRGRGTDGPDGLACQAGSWEAGAILAARRAGPGRASLFLSLEVVSSRLGSEANPFLGAAGKLGPSPVVSKVTGGGQWTQCPA